jgi:hypothetical protein
MGLEVIASHSMALPPKEISLKSMNWFNSYWKVGGRTKQTDTHTHTQAGKLISLLFISGK